MNNLSYVNAIENGDTVLISSEGFETRIFRNALMLTEYFKSSKHFDEAKESRFKFEQFSVGEIRDFVMYLYGIRVPISEQLLNTLDYFQAPMLLKLTKYHFKILSLKCLAAVVKTNMSYNKTAIIYERILKLLPSDDEELMKWVNKYGDEDAKHCEAANKIRVIKSFLKEDWYEAFSDLQEINPYNHHNELMKLASDYRFIEAEAVGSYYTWYVQSARDDE